MARVLILFAHPALHKSRVNRAMAAAVAALDDVTFHDLYEAYPDMHISVTKEQELLRRHDTIVFQHPMFWYSSPAILKEWQDLVLEWGFAYGESGDALRGKKLLSAITTGGPEEAYQRGGSNHFTIRELLAPFEQTARLCGMEYLEPFAIQGVSRLSEAELAAEVDRYRARIQSLCTEEKNA